MWDIGEFGGIFCANPNVEMVFRSPEGKFRRGPAEVITRAMVAGLAPAEFKQLVMAKLQYASNWKSDPNMVMETVEAEAKAWRHKEMLDKLSNSSPQSSRSRNRGSKSAGGAAANGVFQMWSGGPLRAKMPPGFRRGIRAAKRRAHSKSQQWER